MPQIPRPGRPHRTGTTGQTTMTEADLHRSAADFLGWMVMPPAIWTTFPAGWGRLGKATAGSLNGCGLKAGMPDILVFYESTAVGIELKTDGGKVTSVQRRTHEELRKAGIPVVICRSLSDIEDALNSYRIPMRPHKWQGRQENRSTPPAAT